MVSYSFPAHTVFCFCYAACNAYPQYQALVGSSYFIFVKSMYSCYELNCTPSHLYVKVVTPSALDDFLSQGFKEVTKLK